MSDFEKANDFIRNHPKSVSIAVICIGVILCFILLPFGIPCIIAGIVLLMILPKVSRKIGNTSNNNIIHIGHSLFRFPETDNMGHKILTVYDINVTGTMRKHNGINPQLIIRTLRPGNQILLEADPANEFDEYAVKVKNMNGVQIGWLPKGENLQQDISRRLNEGQNVYARVNKIYPLDYYPGNYGLVIDVARYSKR